MTIECYYGDCPHHGNQSGDEGPFCFEPECKATEQEIKWFGKLRTLQERVWELEGVSSRAQAGGNTADELRYAVNCPVSGVGGDLAKLMLKAAEEVERLRAFVASLTDENERRTRQVEALRKALQKITEVEPGLVTTSMDMRQIAQRALKPKSGDTPKPAGRPS